MSRAEGRLVGGRYQLVEPIGRGGMGVVWRAHDELLDRAVAVKEVRYDSAMGDELSDLNRRTMREARAAGRLTHPNVVVVHDVIEEDDRPWIIMQLVPSRSLGQVIREDGPLSPERTVEIGLQILDALRAAHRQGVLHRDVKPENVLLTDDGRVVLTDFGIARLEADSTMTRTGLVGTPAFIAPERLRGEAAQRESDLWSLGATLYTAVEGKPPHDRGMAMATMHAVLNEDPAPPRRAGALGAVLLRMLAKEPADRAGYEELTRLLKRASRDLAPPPSRPAAAEGKAPRGAAPYPPVSSSPPESSPRRGERPAPPAEPGDAAAGPGEITSPIPVVQDEPGTPQEGDVPAPMPETGVQAAPPARTTPSDEGDPAAGDKDGKDRKDHKDGEDGTTKVAPAVASGTVGRAVGGAVAEENREAPEASAEAAGIADAGDRLAGLRQEPPAAPPAQGGAAQGGAAWHAASTTPVEPRSRGGLLKVALVLVPALLVIAGIAGYLGLKAGGDDPGGKPAAGSDPSTGKTTEKPSASAPSSAAPSSAEPSASPSDEPATSASPEPSPDSDGPGPGDVPDGWHKYKHSSGFSIALPKGWHADGRGNGEVRFRGDSHTYLEVHHTSSPESDALKVWQRDVPGMSRNFPGYKLIAIKEVKGYWKTAADWEFTFGDSRYRSRVIDRGFVTDKNNGYALLYKTQDKDWKKKKKLFETMAATFKPAK
ncbi:serine/threonine-protein kinase [Microbispora sp. H13382]|uniref:serine/threonine-protein kinase n=1 Tax=Microbispora sp. H13382 TaxID=2729112 RepID=UPI0015FFE6C2|nr:serine/threonine-protein kinase [Microbispora sp. H13382]